MTIKCPKCGSEHVDKKNYATRSLSVLGGAAAGIAVGLKAFDVISDDTNSDNSLFTSASIVVAAGALGAALGAATGGVLAGATLGNQIDNNVLDNFICLQCDYSFSKD